jgi:DNA-binding transcriptional regulator PaaX
MLHNIHMYNKTVTKSNMAFLKDYPFSAKEAVYTPIIYRFGLEMPATVPFPTLNGIRDLATFAGISDAAIRTAISRANADGSILKFKVQSRTHYTIAPSTFEMGMTTISRDKQAEGFVIAVFSFTKDAESERAVVRETLKNYGFKRLAQNTYINGRIDTKGLLEAMRKFGLEKHLYLFHCPDIDDHDLIHKILDLFELEKRKSDLEHFYQQMVGFLTETGLSDDELGRRMLYFGAIFWTVCEVDEPPIPQKYLPSDYPMPKIRAFYNAFVEENKSKLIQYYIKVNT